MRLIRKPDMCPKGGRTQWSNSLLASHMRVELASHSCCRVKNTCYFSTVVQKNMHGYFFQDQMWANVRGLAGGASRQKQRQNPGLLGAEEVSSCSNGEHICLNQGNCRRDTSQETKKASSNICFKGHFTTLGLADNTPAPDHFFLPSPILSLEEPELPGTKRERPSPFIASHSAWLHTALQVRQL